MLANSDMFHLSNTSASVVSDQRRIRTPSHTETFKLSIIYIIFAHNLCTVSQTEHIISVILLLFVLHLYTGPAQQPVEEVAHYVMPIQSKELPIPPSSSYPETQGIVYNIVYVCVHML